MALRLSSCSSVPGPLVRLTTLTCCSDTRVLTGCEVLLQLRPSETPLQRSRREAAVGRVHTHPLGSWWAGGKGPPDLAVLPQGLAVHAPFVLRQRCAKSGSVTEHRKWTTLRRVSRCGNKLPFLFKRALQGRDRRQLPARPPGTVLLHPGVSTAGGTFPPHPWCVRAAVPMALGHGGLKEAD